MKLSTFSHLQIGTVLFYIMDCTYKSNCERRCAKLGLFVKRFFGGGGRCHYRPHDLEALLPFNAETHN